MALKTRHLALLTVFLGLAGAARSQTHVTQLPLAHATHLEDRILGFQESVGIPLPSFPAKPGQVIILRLCMVSFAETAAGCNLNASLQINDSYLGRTGAGHAVRLIGRPAAFEFRDRYPGAFQVFSGPAIMTMFAPDVAVGNAMSKDGFGATFMLDISDVARGVDGNTLTIHNTRAKSAISKRLDLIVQNIEVGYLDRTQLPVPPNNVPKRDRIEATVRSTNLVLQQSTRGGFAIQLGNGDRLRIETALGMSATTSSVLTAEDGGPSSDLLSVSMQQHGPNRFEMTAMWPEMELVRSVEIRGELVTWRETWRNTSDQTRGVPFRHRLFLDGGPASFRLGGDADVPALAGSPQNPTLFLLSPRADGGSFGIIAESDWLRLLMSLRSAGGVGEIASECLALASGSSIDFTWSIVPLAPGQTYWDFINGVRERWGVNGYSVERPIFWHYARHSEGATAEERIRKSIGHLGPITLAIGPWVRLGFDRRIVRGQRYPKLPEDAPRCPGGTPDLDIEAYLTFAHRKAYWTQYRIDVALLKKACPGTRVIQLSHPAMEVAYKPLAQRWPYAEDAILTPELTPFESPHYSRAHLGDWVTKGWGVLYYVPRPGSDYLQALLRDVRRFLDECDGDGVYFDEFSWAGTRRGYSRYDYSHWDGYSADLDEQGNVLRLKADNAAAAEVAQLEIVRQVRDRGKIFLGNGTAVLRSVNRLPIARFVEGGNGYGTWAGAHLSTVPLILGNFGDKQTRQGVFEAVKLYLSNGCVYSPVAVNLLLEGADNFVCKLYPLAIRRLEAGTVIGKQRIITTKPYQVQWPTDVAALRIYRYDSAGDLEGPAAVVARTDGNSEHALTVPDGGLTIAEFAPSRAGKRSRDAGSLR
ncbi:MAG: hypothetical protein HQ592_17405 [Planctomycetes bacterium]|nr:hypothetical protein [Planctomycetota bacterium]